MKPRARHLILAALYVVGCSRASASMDEPLQGVVEYEDRVLAFEVGGRVEEVKVARGSGVEAGDALVVLDDGLERPLREVRAAELEAARAQLRLLMAGARPEEVRAARAELRTIREQEQIARGALERQERLAEEGAISPVALERADGELSTLVGRRQMASERFRALRGGAREEEVDAAEAQIRAASAALAALDARLSRFTLKAASEGEVVDVHVQPGEVAGPGAPAVTMADLDHPYVDVFVPEGRIGGVRIGNRGHVRVDALARTLPAVVEHIFHRTEFTPRFLFSEKERPNLVLRVRLRVDDPHHRLRAGLPAFAELEPAGSGGEL